MFSAVRGAIKKQVDGESKVLCRLKRVRPTLDEGVHSKSVYNKERREKEGCEI
jgi:hypothetical protein